MNEFLSYRFYYFLLTKCCTVGANGHFIGPEWAMIAYKNLKSWKYKCSDACCDLDDGSGPRKPPGFVFGCDSPDKKTDPGHTEYMSNEERRAYRKY